MLYNKPITIFYKAASSLKEQGQHVLAKLKAALKKLPLCKTTGFLEVKSMTLASGTSSTNALHSETLLTNGHALDAASVLAPVGISAGRGRKRKIVDKTAGKENKSDNGKSLPKTRRPSEKEPPSGVLLRLKTSQARLSTVHKQLVDEGLVAKLSNVDVSGMVWAKIKGFPYYPAEVRPSLRQQERIS